MDNDNQEDNQRSANGPGLIGVITVGLIIAKIASALLPAGEDAKTNTNQEPPVENPGPARELRAGYYQQPAQSFDSLGMRRTHEMMGQTTLCLALYLLASPKQATLLQLDQARQQLFKCVTQSKAEIGKKVTQDTNLQDLLYGCVGPDTLRRIRDISEGRDMANLAQRRTCPGDPTKQRNRDAMVGDKVLDLALYIYGHKEGLDHAQLDTARQKLFSNSSLGGRSQATEREAEVGSLAVSYRTPMLRSLQKCIDATTMTLLHEIVDRYC